MQLEYEEKEEAYLRMKQVELHTPATILNSPHRETILKITNMSDGTCVTASQVSLLRLIQKQSLL